MLFFMNTESVLINLQTGLPKELEGPRANTKSEAHNIERGRGSGGTPQRNFEILHPLKCVLGLLRLLIVHATTHSCKLPSSLSSFRSKSTTYVRALASRLCSSIDNRRYIFIVYGSSY